MNEEKFESEEVKMSEEESAQASDENVEVEAEAEVAEPKEEADTEDFKSKFYYIAAEMENMKRRFVREKESIIKYGSEKIINGLLPVADNLDRTLAALDAGEDENVKNLITGIEMVRDQFVETLKQNGLEPINAIGEIFDPNFHEAMSQQAAEGKEDMEIIAEFEKGYLLNGRLLRASKVVVVKN